MTRRRGGLGGLLTALVLALAVVAPASAAQAATHERPSAAGPIHAQKAHPSARAHAVHAPAAKKISHHLDAAVLTTSIEPVPEGVSTPAPSDPVALTGLETPTALGRGPPAS